MGDSRSIFAPSGTGSLCTQLHEEKSSSLIKWSKRIAVPPSGNQLLAPDIRNDVREVVYEAILHGKRFEADFCALDADKARRYVFNPQDLVAALWD